jgi:transcriptional regulator with XRE-family HTH domain
MVAGLRLRQVRERLGLTYRDVERASFEIAGRRGRPEFIIHISRLADIENHGVVPGLHKIYTLSIVYRLNPVEVCEWYDVPLKEHFADSISFPAPVTHLIASPSGLTIPVRFDPAFDPRRTEFLSRMIERWGQLEGSLFNGNGNAKYRYGYVGLDDRRMHPLLRPGSVVLVDPTQRRIENSDWHNEFERPLYFVEVRGGYRCGWFFTDANRLVMQPHALSHCQSETWRTPEEAEVVGRVIGVVMRLTDS